MANTSIRVDTVGLGISWALNETYRVVLDEGFLEQDGGLNLPIAGGNLTTFSTPANPPLLSNSYPSNSSVNVQEQRTITFTLDRANLTAKTGNIYVYEDASPDVLVRTVPIAANIITGNVISVDIRQKLKANTSYFVRTDANIVMDFDSFNFGGITSNVAFYYTNAVDWQRDLTTVSNINVYNSNTTTLIDYGPELVDGYYDNGTYTTNVIVITSNSLSNLSSSGTLGGTSSYTGNILTITGNLLQTQSHLDNLKLNQYTSYNGNIVIQYNLLTPDGNTSIRTQSIAYDENYASNVSVIRSYPYNTTTNIMATSPIRIIASGTDADNTYTSMIKTNLIGNLSIGGNALASTSNLVITGSKSSVNAQLANVYYHPLTGFVGNTSLTYSQSVNGLEHVYQTITLLQTGSPNVTSSTSYFSVDNNDYDVYVFRANSQIYLVDNLDIGYVAVAGGGGGAGFTEYEFMFGAGAGGAGGVITGTATPSLGYHAITLGQGGQAGTWPGGYSSYSHATNGGNTSIFGFTAIGGGSGAFGGLGGTGNTNLISPIVANPGGGGAYNPTWLTPNTQAGGSAISGQFYAGGADISGPDNGGGGGGAGGVGANASTGITSGGIGVTYYNQYFSPGGDAGTPSTSATAVTYPGAGGPSFYYHYVSGGWGYDEGRAGNPGAIILTLEKNKQVPGAPKIGTAYATGAGTANVSYTKPFRSGNSAIISYTAVSTPGNILANISTSGSGNIQVTGLSSGVSYTFQVYATNSQGSGNLSASSNSITALGVPAAPTITGVTGISNTSVSVSYTAPGNNGGNTITSYTAVSNTGLTATSITSGSGSIVVNGVSVGNAYDFIVYATNYYGNSANSSVSNSISVYDPPGAPTITAVTLYDANTKANISFTAPSSNGGNTIQFYTAFSNVGGIGGNVSQSGNGYILVTGLSTETTYSFQVYAVNSYIKGPDSNASTVSTPEGDPYFDYVQLLIQGGAPNGNTTIIDSKSHTTNLNTGVDYSNVVTKWQSTSVYFDGNEYIRYAYNTDLYPTGDFTWEFWLYPTTTASNQYVIYHDISSPISLFYQQSIGNVKIQMDRTGDGVNEVNFDTSHTFTANTWQHFAVTRSGNNVRVFKDGSQVGSTQTFTGTPSYNGSISIGSNDGGGFLVGYMDDIRFSKGLARYISDFTPPTKAFAPRKT